MKRTAKSLPAIVSMAFTGIVAMLATFVSVAPANASEILPPVTRGTVTCRHYTSLTAPEWPQSFWNCDSSLTEATARNVTNGANAIWDKTKFQNTLNSYDVYVFKNAADFHTFTGAPTPAANALGGIALGAGTPPPGGGATPNVAAVFTNVTLHGSSFNVSANFRNHMAQTIARVLYRSSLKPSWNIDVRLPAGLKFDDYNTAEAGKTAVWGSLANSYPSTYTPWDILGAEYGNSNEDVFAYQMAKLAAVGAPYGGLNTALGYMPNSLGIVKNYVWDDVVTDPATAYVRNGRYAMCVQYSTGFVSEYPSVWYSCAHPYLPQPAESQLKNTVRNMPLAIRTNQLAANGVRIFAMRDWQEFEDYFSQESGQTITLPAHVGVLGGSNSSLQVAAAFYFKDNSPGAPTIIDGLMNNSIIHEIGHLLNAIWGDPAGTSTTFSNAYNADKTAFNNKSCQAAIDQYRQQLGLSLVCGIPGNATRQNWDILLDSDPNTPGNQVLHPNDKFEMWCNSVAYNTAGTTIGTFWQKIQNQMTQQNAYMNAVFQGATP